MTIYPKKQSRGFNLVETLAASVILSSAVLTVAAISTRALTGTKLNRQYEIAASLIDKQLALIDYIGIDEFIEAGQTDGVFDEFEPVYYWQIATEYQYIDSLYLVTMKVTWMEHNHPYSITVDTMLDGISMYADVGSQ
jgi:hypothetical protein